MSGDDFQEELDILTRATLTIEETPSSTSTSKVRVRDALGGVDMLILLIFC